MDGEIARVLVLFRFFSIDTFFNAHPKFFHPGSPYLYTYFFELFRIIELGMSFFSPLEGTILEKGTLSCPAICICIYMS